MAQMETATGQLHMTNAINTKSKKIIVFYLNNRNKLLSTNLHSSCRLLLTKPFFQIRIHSYRPAELDIWSHLFKPIITAMNTIRMETYKQYRLA